MHFDASALGYSLRVFSCLEFEFFRWQCYAFFMETAIRSRSRISSRTELRRIRSLAISLVGVDSEGTYRPEFVEEVLRAVSEPATKKFKSSADFLKQLKAV